MKTTRNLSRVLTASTAVLAVIGVAATVQAAPAEKAGVEIYGFIQTDAIYDFNKMDPDWNSTLRPSKIPVNCPGDAGCGENGETVFSVRQSRLGFNGFIPTEMGELKTKFEFDLFGTGPDAGKTTIRLRHAYGELGEFLVGQTNSLFMDGDVFPNTIDYWGPTGMIFFRNIQARWTFLKQDGMKAAVALEAPGSAIDAGQTTVIDPSLTVNSWNKYPDVTGQLRMDRGWGHFQAAGILRWLGYDTPDQSVSGHQTGWGVNLSGAIHTVGKDNVLMQLAYGHGIANYFNDGGVDLAPSNTNGTGAEALPILGVLVYYDHYWNTKWSSSVGYSETSQDNSGGQLANAYSKGQYMSANLLHYPVKNVLVGGELLWGERENNNGNTGSDSRIQFSAKYNF
jgi:DcaP outer membrane protein